MDQTKQAGGAPALEGGEKGLNVCLLNDSFPPVIDGVANAVVNYARVIWGRYGRCTVVTPEYPGVKDEYPFPVVRYPSIDTTRLAGYRTGNPFDPATVARLGGMGFDILHCHCPVTSAMLARSLRDVVNAPVVFTYHTKFDIDIARAIKGRALQSAAVKLLVNNITACDEVWVVSRGAGENLRSLGFDGEYIVMPNGVDLPKGRAEEAARGLDRTLDLPRDVPVYLFVGRIMWYKGLRLILDALARLKGAGRDFRMVFVGDGQDREAAEDYARELGLENECVFVGALRDREAIRAWYTRGDLLLFPSTFDTNGLVVREAAACGLGSLLIRGSCAAEGIQDGETGILVEETAESLAGALMRPEAGREWFRQLGENAMERIYLSWEDSVAAACRRYQQVRDRWERGELHRRKVPLDGLYDVSGEVAEALETARAQRQETLAQLRRELERVRDRLDRYL